LSRLQYRERVDTIMRDGCDFGKNNCLNSEFCAWRNPAFILDRVEETTALNRLFTAHRQFGFLKND
jgi:hypothetical protein